MRIAEMIATLPPDTPLSVTVGTGSMTAEDLRRAFVATQKKRLLTTAEASDLFGYSQSQWAKWAAAGEIQGAYQDADGTVLESRHSLGARP